MIEMFNIDCMEYMAKQPDKSFDLAVVGPPYGIGENWKKDPHSDFYKHSTSYKNNEVPGPKYFEELFRVSKNQIIWGANYYTEYLSARNSWIVWDKKRDYPKQHMAEGELAWTSFNIPLRIFEGIWNGFVRCDTRAGFHPHEKPIKLYSWIFQNYAKPGQRILDTHGGSFSSAIAAHYFGCDMVICEIDKDYFDAGKARFEKETKQIAMF